MKKIIAKKKNPTKLKPSTVEPQYNACQAMEDKYGRATFGLMSSHAWLDDPKRLAFLFARYKFVSKMLAGKKSALEIGCADAFGTRVVRQAVPLVTATDFDPIFVADAQKINQEPWPINIFCHDILSGPVPGRFESAFSLDVLEHIPQKDENLYFRNICASLTSDGVFIVGSPSLESQPYASAQSKAGHVNCKSGPVLKALVEKYFHNAFLFSMNDEVLHTGFHSMAHYLLVIGCGVRRQ